MTLLDFSKKFLSLLALAIVAPGMALAAETLAVESVVAEVLRENPSLAAAQSRWFAARERIPQERAWADPTLQLRVNRGDFLGDIDDTSYEFMQEIPLSGKNLVRGRIAAAEADSRAAATARERNALAALARVAFHRYANARTQLAINTRNTLLLRQITDAIRVRYETSMATQGEILNAETALAESEDAAADFTAAAEIAQARLNVLLNRDAFAPLPPPAPVAFRPLPQSARELTRTALTIRPEVSAAFSATEAAAQRESLARRAWVPDPQIIVEGRNFTDERRGDFGLDVGVQFSIPWVNPGKYQAAEREAAHERDAALRDLETERLVTAGRIREALAEIDAIAHHYHNYADRIVPLARRAAESNRIAFENGSGPFREMLDAQLTAANAEATLANHLADYLSAIADLESFVGIAAPAPKP